MGNCCDKTPKIPQQSCPWAPNVQVDILDMFTKQMYLQLELNPKTTMGQIKQQVQHGVPKFKNCSLRLFLNCEIEFYVVNGEVKTVKAFFNSFREKFYAPKGLIPTNVFQPQDRANFLDLNLTIGNTFVFFVRPG